MGKPDYSKLCALFLLPLFGTVGIGGFSFAKLLCWHPVTWVFLLSNHY